MKILFTGKSDFNYNRVKVIKAGIEQIPGVEIIEYPIIKRKEFDITKLKEIEQKVDFIYIPPFRHRDVSFIKKHTTKPLIFDPLISKYLTKDDYGQFWKLPFKYLLDFIPFKKADILLTDTNEHRQYFIKKFKLNAEKVNTLYIGADTRKFFKKEKSESLKPKFIVGFYGSFVPLQGTDKIIEAAYHLKNHEDIHFEIVGAGYTFNRAKKLAKKWNLNNIHFHGNVSYEQLNPLINSFDLCLGIFGDSIKADMVIPNKIYHYASIGKCVLTKNTLGIKELFTDDNNIALCDNNPEIIAQNILALKESPSKITHIGQEAEKLLRSSYNEIEIAQNLITILKNFKLKGSNPKQ